MINPRDIDRDCIPVSVRATYDTIQQANVDSPKVGDLVIIDGEPYYYDSRDGFVPYGWQHDVAIPESAFIDPDNPTLEEAEAWIDANHPIAPGGSRFYYEQDGTTADPDWVWEVDGIGEVYTVEKPGGSLAPVSIIEIIGNTANNADFYGGNSYAKLAACAITQYSWMIVEISTGTVLSAFSGVAGADASGETGVKSGTYDQFTLDNIAGICGDIEITLEVTDCDGRISDVTTYTLANYGMARMAFNYDGTDPFEATIITSDGSDVVWTFSDGFTATGMFISRPTGGVPGTGYALACKAAVTEINFNGTGASGNISSLFDDDPEGFTALEVLDLEGSTFGGELVAFPSWPNLTEVNAPDNQLSGVLNYSLPAGMTLFNIANNSYQGLIPSPTAATGLTVYDVSNNGLSGEIHDFSGLTSLTVWDVSDNNVEGTLPASITGLTDLTWFAGKNTNITGSLSNFIGLTNLERVDFNNAALSGTLNSLETNTALQYFNVAENDLTGDLPSAIGLFVLSDYIATGNTLQVPPGGSVFLGNNALSNILVSNNAMGNAAQVAALICNVEGLATFGGVLNINGNNVSPTPPGVTCANDLTSRGWTVII